MKSFFTILWDALLKFKEDDCITLASAISFVFMLSLIPFLTLAAKIFSLVQNSLIYSHHHINQMDLIIKELHEIIPFVSSEWLILNTQASSSKSLTFFSLLMLPVISGIIFHELETSYRKIFSIHPRLIIVNQFFYAFFTIIVLLIIFTANFVWAVLSSFLTNFTDSFQNSQAIFKLLNSLEKFNLLSTDILSILILMLFFIITSIIFLPPKIKLKFRHRFISAFIFALMWNTAKQAFSFYLSNISIVNLIYGSISSVIIILIWIFYSSVILLFSVEIMFQMFKKESMVLISN
ncbi:MAG: YihY/virulence factor BrkB family protein [Desulfobacteraceae bacterium]|nr:YihY/virulence factor BrkB family protein [Desulfobacteraceae bacterium]MCB9493978.1 YihY/virulence factor BrkB family protein [Desulfobacteraceae bacterium]